MTTVVIGRDGKLYDLGCGEFPGKKTLVQNAFSCPQEEAEAMKREGRLTSLWANPKTRPQWER